MPNAVIDKTLKYVKRCGYCDFENDGTFDSETEEQVVLDEGQLPEVGDKVVDGKVAVMTVQEQTAVDEAVLGEKKEACTVSMETIYASTDELPLPAPKDGLQVLVMNKAVISFAISSGGKWLVFAPTETIG